MKTVSRFDRDGSGRRGRLGTEKMAGVVAFCFSVFHCDEVLVFIFEWLHRAFRFSVFEPFYFPVRIPVPDVGHDLFRLALEFSRLIGAELVVRGFPGSFVVPFHVFVVYLYYKVSVGSPATVHVSGPPRSAGGSYVVCSGIVKKVDEYEHTIIMTDQTVIPLEQLSDIKCEEW